MTEAEDRTALILLTAVVRMRLVSGLTDGVFTTFDSVGQLTSAAASGCSASWCWRGGWPASGSGWPGPAESRTHIFKGGNCT